MTGPNSDSASIVGLAADVVAAYVSNNKLAASDLPVLIQRTFGALSDVHGAKREEPPKPATSIRKSVTDAHLVCLEDGERLKSLKRHLMSRHGLTPEEYRPLGPSRQLSDGRPRLCGRAFEHGQAHGPGTRQSGGGRPRDRSGQRFGQLNAPAAPSAAAAPRHQSGFHLVIQETAALTTVTAARRHWLSAARASR